MSNKSGTAEQVISLPKGGGAVSGIGETFSSDLFTGTGNFTVPIALPPGRNGFQPELSLVYSSGNGNSPFGLGWGLSVPGVSRKTSKGVPIYDDATDTFILSGAEDLVPVEHSPTATRYRPRTEGLFARIIHHHDPANDYWEVRSKDGLVSLYGTPDAAGADPAVVADPSNRSRVFDWKLSETRDPFGNLIKYEYERDSGTDGPHQWDHLDLERIAYVNLGDESDDRFLVEVLFHYEARPDPFSVRRAGFEVRTRRRCSRIEISTHADQPRLARTYGLVYLDQRHDLTDLEQRLPPNGVSLLSQVQVTGHDGQATESLPPLECGYSRFQPEGRDFRPLTGRDLPAGSLGRPELELADLFGNGLPDILELNGTARYWRNLGGGRFDLPRPMRDAPAGLRLADPNVQLMDADGDGRIDLLVNGNGLSGFFPLQHTGEWDRRSFRRYRQAPSFSLADPEVKLVDLDGDGITDVIRSGARMECFFNDPEQGGWHASRFVERRALDQFPDVSFSDPRVKWGDMSGDGLQDIVLVHDGNIEYWPSLGHGAWGPRIHMQNSPRFRDAGYSLGYDPRRVLIGDVDGDGLADLVYVHDRRITLWLNQSGNGWSDPIEIAGTPPVHDLNAVRLVDLLGTGIAGVLWTADADGSTRERMFFLDFTGGLKPYLLDEMDNHMGAITRVRYEPSTHAYLADQGRAETRWQTTLPFPVQVVARVEVIDVLSRGKLTTEYAYHHGYWDGAEREFRGFGLVEQRDTETFETYNAAGMHGADTAFAGVDTRHFSPPTLTRTWFHQGPIGEEHGDWMIADHSAEYWPGDPPLLHGVGDLDDFLRDLPRRDKRDALRALRGRTLRTELYALDGSDRQDRPYTITESRFGLREESPPGPDQPDRRGIFFPYTLAERTTQWERGDEPMTLLGFTEHYDAQGRPDHFDAYGQPRSQISIAVPRWRGLDLGEAVTIASDGLLPDTPAHEREHAQSLERYRITQTLNDYAQRDSDAVYIVDRVARTTTREIRSTGREDLFQLKDAIARDQAPGDIIGQSLSFYDGPSFQGLPVGQIGDHGALVRTDTLVLTQDILQQAYRSGDQLAAPPEMPPYLDPNGAPSWTGEYPQPFRDALPARAGYAYHDGAAGSEHATGYFIASDQRSYDFQASPAGPSRGLPVAMRDPLGHETRIAYDAYDLLPVRVTDPVGLATSADYDYRVLQPRLVTDANGNRQALGFTPLGLPAWIAVMGKDGEQFGDTPDTPGTRFDYDFLAFANSPPEARQPVFVRSVRREHHVQDHQVPLPERDQTITTVEYSDGFGRLLQTRTQGEDLRFGQAVFGGGVLPADQADTEATRTEIHGHRQAPGAPPNVVVSGSQVFDNKGQVVEQYEPFFSSGWDYGRPGEHELGQRVTMIYDPRGQVIRTHNPDGSEQRVIYGVPPDLTDPDRFDPTPWEAYTYDVNDLAPLSTGTDAQGNPVSLADRAPPTHHFTPASIGIDALGRTVESIQRNGPDPVADWYRTRTTYDIRGNVVQIIDAVGRRAFHHVHDLANNPLRIDSIDAGVRRTVLDAAGNEIERRDSKGALILQTYDQLQRPVRLWARDAANEPMTLRERLEYGDDGDPGQIPSERDAARQSNRLGRLHRHFDEAGRLTLEDYDFKGNVREKVRQVIGDGPILAVFSAPGGGVPPGGSLAAFRVDWEPPSGTDLASHTASLLDPTDYRTSSTYDALNRTRELRYPQDVDGKRKTLRPRYNRAGALQQLALDDQPYVQHIAYDAKGQRTLIAYGNGVMTRYAYDPQTFRLTRLRSERYLSSLPAPDTYRPAGAALQDFAYQYDLAGNITAILDRTPESGIPNTLLGTDALDRRFTYDPIYRLLSATGRESDLPPEPAPWDDRPRNNDPTRVRAYTEHYQYDPAGNLIQLLHQAGGHGFTRNLNPAADNNRLTSVVISDQISQRYDYAYDSNGNMTGEASSRHFEWNHSDQMKAFRTQAPGAAAPSIRAQYLYDAGGQRVKKLVRDQGGSYAVTVYVDGIFERQWSVQAGIHEENNMLHVMDGAQRIALVRVGTPFSDDRTPATKYHIGDHLGSSNVVIDDSGRWINREEYTPYGETSFGSFSRKRYRFTGKERDKESGLFFHGARYFSVWVLRWMSPDPVRGAMARNLFVAFANNPLGNIDPSGTSEKPPPTLENVSESEIDVDLINPQHPLRYGLQDPGVREMLQQVIPKGDNPGISSTVGNSRTEDGAGNAVQSALLNTDTSMKTVDREGIVSPGNADDEPPIINVDLGLKVPRLGTNLSAPENIGVTVVGAHVLLAGFELKATDVLDSTGRSGFEIGFAVGPGLELSGIGLVLGGKVVRSWSYKFWGYDWLNGKFDLVTYETKHEASLEATVLGFGLEPKGEYMVSSEIFYEREPIGSVVPGVTEDKVKGILLENQLNREIHIRQQRSKIRDHQNRYPALYRNRLLY